MESLVVPLLDPAPELCRGSGGRLAHVGKRATRARGAHTSPSSPPWDRTRLLQGCWTLGASGRARCSHTLRTLPGRARRRRRRLLLPGSRRGGAEGERGCAERAGRGLSAVGGSEGASERASERAGHFCAAPERLGARPGGHWTRGPRDRQTAPGSHAAAARLAGRGDRAGCRYVRSPACWRTCVAGAGATIRVFAGTCVGGSTSPGVC